MSSKSWKIDSAMWTMYGNLVKAKYMSVWMVEKGGNVIASYPMCIFYDSGYKCK